MREGGTFERSRVTVKHPARNVTGSEGFWSGAFSGRRDTEGAPRLMAGFSSVPFTESNGGEGDFFGSFLGLGGLLYSGNCTRSCRARQIRVLEAL